MLRLYITLYILSMIQEIIKEHVNNMNKYILFNNRQSRHNSEDMFRAEIHSKFNFVKWINL